MEIEIKKRDELLRYIDDNKSFDIGNRSIAIKKAIQNADPQEIILVAGKGHEEQQVYKNKIFKISDKKIIKQIILKTEIISKQKQNYIQNQLIINNILNKKKQVDFNGVSIDSRTLKKGNLFLAIKGKKHDGYKFIDHALKKGAGCIVTSSKVNKNNKKIIKIKNPISFLNRFAKLKRIRFI